MHINGVIELVCVHNLDLTKDYTRLMCGKCMCYRNNIISRYCCNIHSISLCERKVGGNIRRVGDAN